MSEMTDVVAARSPLFERPRQIASWWHLAGYVLVVMGIAAWGFQSQQAGHGGSAPTDSKQLGEHGAALWFYLSAALGDLAFLYYCWMGVHHHGGTFETLTGGRWRSVTDVAKDVAMALPFWLLWEAVAFGVWRLLGPSDALSIDALLPQSVPEIFAWIGVSIVAGFTEEIQSRGYLQQQLHALSGNIVAAILGQAVFFGLLHSYQGWKSVIVITTLGILYGALAVYRRNLRASILAHAWSDIWEGWLKMLVWR
ncbi:CPBP family intramembrane glutamic endopeptidase [Dyella sp. 20L07]|uniref:CPBP family intramembrane glutamic endopeptidase n=1 Tax=Dyella sp. 20L07 TaxID=3384240 RepID=UPI003D283835